VAETKLPVVLASGVWLKQTSREQNCLVLASGVWLKQNCREQNCLVLAPGVWLKQNCLVLASVCVAEKKLPGAGSAGVGCVAETKLVLASGVRLKQNWCWRRVAG
jgi:hypothetical protein